MFDESEQPWEFRKWLLRPVLDAQHRTRAQVHEAIRRIDLLGEAMAVQQSDLDAIAAGLVSTEGSLQQAIANLQADIDAGNNLSLDGIQQAAAGLAALVPSSTGGGEPPVSDDPSASVVDGSGDDSGDGGDVTA